MAGGGSCGGKGNWAERIKRHPYGECVPDSARPHGSGQVHAGKKIFSKIGQICCSKKKNQKGAIRYPSGNSRRSAIAMGLSRARHFFLLVILSISAASPGVREESDTAKWSVETACNMTEYTTILENESRQKVHPGTRTDTLQ
jgi:hypothetical protein